MSLSKSERKYRTKFIQERHYNKFEQRTFDDYQKTSGMTYKTIYNRVRSGAFYSFMAENSLRRLSQAFARAGMSAAEAAINAERFASYNQFSTAAALSVVQQPENEMLDITFEL